MSEVRRYVLIWVAPEFLRSSGMIQLFTEAGIFVTPPEEMDEYSRSAEAAGGFALTGTLAEMSHGAGIWISPVNTTGLELMVPWQFVKSVVTAESPQASKVFGLASDGTDAAGTSKTKSQRSRIRNNSK